MFHYHLLKEILYSDELGEYISFGIQVTNQRGDKVASVSDISTKQDYVEELCRLFNKNNLSPLHLRDVIEDMLLV